MPTEKEMVMAYKAMAYDLVKLFESEPEKKYSVEELKKLLDAYIQGAKQ